MMMEVSTIMELLHLLFSFDPWKIISTCQELSQEIWDQNLATMGKIMAGLPLIKLEFQEIKCFKNSFKLTEKALFQLKVI